MIDLIPIFPTMTEEEISKMCVDDEGHGHTVDIVCTGCAAYCKLSHITGANTTPPKCLYQTRHTPQWNLVSEAVQ